MFVIVCNVATSKCHRCYGVNVDATVCKCCCYSAMTHDLPFHVLMKMVSSQELASLCDHCVNTVSSFGSF